MIRLPRPGAAWPFARLLLLAVFAITSAWHAGSTRAGPPAQTAPATPTERPPTPTPSPPDAELAAEFARQGKVDEAIGADLAVIEQGSPSERLAARLAVAALLLDDGQVSAAVRQFDAYLLEAPAGADVRDAQFLLAEALASQGDGAGALPLYDAYIAGGGAASVYARLGRAQALARLGRATEATQEAEQLLSEDLPRPIRLGLVLGMAQALEESSPSDALAWYDRLRSETDSPADEALALWRSALIRGEQGDIGSWLTIIQRYPDTPTAQQIVDEPPPIKGIIMLDSYYPGLIYYRAGRTAEALEAFKASLVANRTGGDRTLAARTSYYLAVLDERAGDVDEAIAGYARVVALDRGVDLADDALWWRGRLLEQDGRRNEAEGAYRRLIEDYRGSGWASDARFRLALLVYDGGDERRAADEFASVAEDERDSERQRALLWRGKALAAAGDDDAAEEVWKSLRDEAPDDYYGLRAAVLLGEARGRLEDAGIDAQDQLDWSAIETWLRQARGGDPSLARQALLGNPHLPLGRELLALGMERRAGAELTLLLDRASGDTTMLLQLTRSFYDLGLSHLSAQAAARLLNEVPEQAAEDAPDDLWRLAYPAPFIDVLREAADDEDVPDVLLLALVRQESFFDPLAGSSAGALGLTQVIPPTGMAIARDLKVADFPVDDLYRPAVSLRFGAHYLRDQLDTFDGNVYQALAAYNGGPGNALRWARAAGNDVDRFVAEIEFSQTELYVQLVAENLARYRQLYDGLEEPSLPRN